jgi:hypothetical protein
MNFNRTTKHYFKLILAFIAINAIWLFPETASAITQPAVGDFGYDIYDIAVNGILQGPIGFVGGLAAIVVGAVFAIKQQFMGAIPCVLGGAAIIQGDTIVQSLGMLI